ncbi:hypothetical protein IWQ60_006178 [Tieghemiomyces parasiticus]|uniref:Uncharacterized protein n=1 Tax=Tieghemiomyces parasiticus TaxID=78921 RepID=A0A9W8A8L5_9FUNG|nr:hypothetical protein IWQ60_006178 [Tieghemiomyces parasiticus]
MSATVLSPHTYTVTKPSLLGNELHVIDEHRQVRYRRPSGKLGLTSSRRLVDHVTGSVLWQPARGGTSASATASRRELVSPEYFIRVALVDRAGFGSTEYRFTYAEEAFLWRRRGRLGFDCDCIRVRDGAMVATVDHSFWRRGFGKVTVRPDPEAWPLGFTDFLIASAIDTVEALQAGG